MPCEPSTRVDHGRVGSYNAAMHIDIYTDGGCWGNPGPGAWAYILVIEDDQKPASGYEPETTNNRMELTAVIRALEEIESFRPWREAEIDLYTDSQYVYRGITEWIDGWRRKSWITSAGTPVKNRDLWTRVAELDSLLSLKWHWVRGHVGDALNEACDKLVQAELKRHR